MALPNLTDAERKAALEKAVEARRKRADFKNQVSSGELTAEKALATAAGDETLCKMKVTDFLRTLPGIGKAKAQEALATLEIAETRRVRGLGKVQHSQIVDLCKRIDKRAAAAAAKSA